MKCFNHLYKWFGRLIFQTKQIQAFLKVQSFEELQRFSSTTKAGNQQSILIKCREPGYHRSGLFGKKGKCDIEVCFHQHLIINRTKLKNWSGIEQPIHLKIFQIFLKWRTFYPLKMTYKRDKTQVCLFHCVRIITYG